MNENISSRTITFLFTDIEGSTKLLQRLGDKYTGVLLDHNKILRDSLKKFGGKEIDTAGDGFFISFDKAKNGILAAAEIQKNINLHKWTDGISLKVRMGIHTGEPEVSEAGYVGIDVHKASRLSSAAHGGQVLISESTKTLVQNDLPAGISVKELGDFKLRDLEKTEKIYQLEINGLPQDFPPINSSSHVKSNLPFNLISLIGREKEIKDVRKLILDESVRLVTLTGPGGTGKTSLAYNVSESLKEEFRDGVYAVLLASTSDPSLVASAIAQTLGVTESPDRNILNILIDYFREKEMLLFLDNYEQIVSSAMILDELLEACHNLKILVTSRIILNLKHETEYFVPPLSLPDLKNFDSTQSISQFAAVKLFIERAKEVNPDFKVTDENAPALAEICVRLDGLPLAIELASARIKIFTPQMILSRLCGKLDILKSTSRSLPERHQTLKQAISWSYDLLSDDEKRLFRWMSVFSGGCSVEALENIFSGMKNLQIDTLDGVEALISKSLLRRTDDANNEPRFYMLETIREYACEIMEEEEKKNLMEHYNKYFLQLAERTEPNLSKARMEYWLNMLDADNYNFRTSLTWAVENNDSELALRLCGALWKFRIIRGNLVESLREIMSAVDMPRKNMNTAYRAKALNAAGTIVHEISDYERSLKLLEEALGIYRELDDEPGIAMVLNNIAWVNIHLGNVNVANLLCDEAINLNLKLKNETGVAVAKNNMAWLAFEQGNFEEALLYNRESRAIRKKIEDPRGTAFANMNIGWVKVMLGMFDEASELMNEAVKTIKEVKDNQLIAFSNYLKGVLYHSTGDYESAEDCVHKSMTVMKDIGNKWVICNEIILLGHIKLDKGEFATAKKLLEEGVDLFRHNGSKWGCALALIWLAQLYREEKNHDNAKSVLRNALELSVETRNNHFIMLCLDEFAGLLVSQNDYKNAGLLLGASEVLRKSTKYHYAICESLHRERNIGILKENNMDSYVEEGKKLKPEDAVRIALE